MISPITKYIWIISLTASVGITGCCYFIYKKLKSKRPPTTWRKLANVTNLYVYPLKSGRYIELDKVECTKFGFSLPTKETNFQLRDRSFIVYGENDSVGKSARIYPKMVLISVSAGDKGHVIFKAPEQDELRVHILEKSSSNIKTIKFQSWSDEYVSTIDLGDEAAKWFSRYLLEKDSGLRLGYHDSSSYRSINSFKDKESLKFYEYVTNDVFGLYSDLAALLLLNEKSVDDLNEKLKNKVTTKNFRPNIVINGDIDPFVEDNYLWIKIGDVILRNVKDCTRCVLTTVDPETGIRDTSREPLKTLSKYRISKGPGKGPIMGINLEVVVPGEISVTDEVFVG
ncbi:hypothetical protein WA026_000398 [Henosepilachna vigintioctopunctata]|uniref:MOSC domain-containing protein n=1 Tax=Henosepilachna vigintioctopunctata TaxID=420089 RepID=A0AAW1UZ63_9CUCU